MVGVWLVFTVILFVAEPLFLHRYFLEQARVNPAKALTAIEIAHWVPQQFAGTRSCYGCGCAGTPM